MQTALTDVDARDNPAKESQGQSQQGQLGHMLGGVGGGVPSELSLSASGSNTSEDDITFVNTSSWDCWIVRCYSQILRLKSTKF